VACDLRAAWLRPDRACRTAADGRRITGRLRDDTSSKDADRLTDAAQLFARLETEQEIKISPDTAYYMARTFAALPAEQHPKASSGRSSYWKRP
jgi:hypothetical protein